MWGYFAPTSFGLIDKIQKMSYTNNVENYIDRTYCGQERIPRQASRNEVCSY
jgi:hypothetical protein